jgi:hypothetical protein
MVSETQQRQRHAYIDELCFISATVLRWWEAMNVTLVDPLQPRSPSPYKQTLQDPEQTAIRGPDVRLLRRILPKTSPSRGLLLLRASRFPGDHRHMYPSETAVCSSRRTSLVPFLL